MTLRPSLPALPLAILLLGFSTADAATLTVTTLADSGTGSLREAIAIALPGDTIEFAVTGTIFLTGGALSIGQDLVINGPGADDLAISGNSRAFEVSAAADVTIRDLAVRETHGPTGAGIRNQGTLLLERVTVQNNFAGSGTAGVLTSGSLTLRSCLLQGNDGDFAGTVTSSGPLLEVEGTVFRNNRTAHLSGGILLNAGALTVRDSTFQGNVSDGSGALTVATGATADIRRSLFSNNNGNTSGGAIINRGTLNLTNCTLSGNLSTSEPGGATGNSGTITVDQCSIVFNRAPSSAGGVQNSGTFTARNTIIAGNLAGSKPDFAGTLTSAGHNLIQNPSGTVVVGDPTGNLLGVDPLLGPLAMNGGPTATHAAGDPVVDVGGNAGAAATDQRGFARIVDGDGDLVAITDIGAYERQGGDCVDTDGDGFVAPLVPGEPCASSVDCNDEDPAVRPGATELCNSIDDNCDGMFPVTEADLDGDGSPTCAGDCNDANPSRYPGAPELCDGLDNDCNGVVPGAESDADRDLYRVCHGDCDDLVPSRHPGAPELCDGLDNDCDGVVPGAESDADHDSYRVCDGDCADSDAAIFPGAPEVCDGLDNDCDGFVDSGASLIPSRIEPSTINIRSGGNAFSVELTFTCGGTSFDPVLVGPVHVSRISSYLFPDPFGLACPSGGLLAPERGIVDNIAARVLTGAGRLSMKFDRAPDGNCSTLDGDRPSLFPFLLGGGEFQEICLAGSFGAQPFETCSTVKVIQPN